MGYGVSHKRGVEAHQGVMVALWGDMVVIIVRCSGSLVICGSFLGRFSSFLGRCGSFGKCGSSLGR